MVKINYLTHFNKTICVHGFDSIINDAFVTVHADKRLIVISSGQTSSEDNRKFSVQITEDRKIYCERLYRLLDEYQLFDTRFAYHSIANAYFPTDMAV